MSSTKVGIDKALVQAARLWVSHYRPYYASALFRCPIIESDELTTLAIDEKWRIYANPAYVNGLEVSRMAAALIHEINHNLRVHAERSRIRGIPSSLQMIWNIAGDLEMNDDLKADGLDVDAAWMYPERFELPDGKTAEWYFDELSKQNASGDSSNGEGDGEGGSGNKISDEAHNCGSGAHGHKGDYEADEGGNSPGVSDAEAEMIRRKVAKDVLDYERVKGRGSVPGGLSRWAEELLNPVVDWRKVFAGSVRRGIASVAGRQDYCRSRLARRDDPSMPVVYPGMVKPVPKVSVVIDTSGSMSSTDLGMALAELKGILRSIGVSGSEIQVLSCDSAVATSRKVFSVKQVDLSGGGGTDMSIGINEADKASPSVIVVLTDGDTPWGNKPKRTERVVVGVISRNAARLADVPAWAKAIHIPVK